MGIEVAGAPITSAPLVVVAVHGRGQPPAYMIEHVVDRLERPDLAYLLPAAEGESWYPEGFMAPVERNEPRLTQALERMEDARAMALAAGFGDHQVVWLGFSQGACLVAEYVARARARTPAARTPGTRTPTARPAALVCFTGGLIGPPDVPLTRPSSLNGLPVLLTTSDVDEWVPLPRVKETAAIFEAAGAAVELVVTPGAGHEILDDSIQRGAALLRRVTERVGERQ